MNSFHQGMKITWLEHLRRFRGHKLDHVCELLELSKSAYYRLEKGRRRPSAKLTFALFVLFEGYSFGALMLKAEFSRGPDPEPFTIGQRKLVESWKPRQFAHLRYHDPIYKISKSSIISVEPRRDSASTTPPGAEQRLPPLDDVRYRTGRWSRPWVAKRRQAPNIHPAKINRLMEIA